MTLIGGGRKEQALFTLLGMDEAREVLSQEPAGGDTDSEQW